MYIYLIKLRPFWLKIRYTAFQPAQRVQTLSRSARRIPRFFTRTRDKGKHTRCTRTVRYSLSCTLDTHVRTALPIVYHTSSCVKNRARWKTSSSSRGLYFPVKAPRGRGRNEAAPLFPEAFIFPACSPSAFLLPRAAAAAWRNQ